MLLELVKNVDFGKGRINTDHTLFYDGVYLLFIEAAIDFVCVAGLACYGDGDCGEVHSGAC